MSILIPVAAVVALITLHQPARDQVVVVPAADGHVGAVVVTAADGRQTVLDQAYAAATVDGSGAVRTGSSDAAAVRQGFADALAAQPPRPVSFQLYFVEGSVTLTEASRPTLTDIFTTLRQRPAPEVVVIGHTDRVGASDLNDRLSLKRAEEVRDELVRQGLDPARVSIAGRGEREPLVPTADDVAEARNRRVEINVR